MQIRLILIKILFGILLKMKLGWLELERRYENVLVGLVYKEKTRYPVMGYRLIIKSRKLTDSSETTLSFKYSKELVRIFKYSSNSVKT